MKTTAPDLGLLNGVVADRVIAALRVSSAELARAGVRHWIVGGLAVGAYGYARATKDVNFLVGDEAFEHHAGGVVTMKLGVPIQVNGVVVDHLSATEEESFLTQNLPAAGATMTVAPCVPQTQVATVEGPHRSHRIDQSRRRRRTVPTLARGERSELRRRTR